MSITRKTARRFISALTEECKRTMRHLKVPGYPRTYYLSYLLRDIHTTEIWGRLGEINYASDQDSRNMYCDVRVGSYRYDQVSEGGLSGGESEGEAYDHVEMPIGNDVDALKFHVWRLTEARYREAVRDYLRRKSDHITFVDPNKSLASFRKTEPNEDLRFTPFKKVDTAAWRDFVKRSSRVVKGHPEVKNSWVEVRIRQMTRMFVSSEGVRLVDQSQVCELSCTLWLLTDAGEGIDCRITHTTPDPTELPDLRTFNRAIRDRIKLLKELSQAPSLKSYAGPVLLAAQPAGILMHEVLGHRLEGSRLLSSREGQTFKRDLGKRILPEFLSVRDDPTLRRSAGVQTVGSYRYDDEGSPATEARLVDNGVLVGFLSGRAPISRRRAPGNGHARGEYDERPISRMANLVVETDQPHTERELMELFREEIRQQDLPFGIMILDAEGGETATSSYNFQAFLGSISLAVQVWADGHENLVRNVNFVGTPLSALRNIVAAGDAPLCCNAFCGAESGVVPVSTTSPALLLANLELQASDQRKFTPFVLPMPHEVSSRKKKNRR